MVLVLSLPPPRVWPTVAVLSEARKPLSIEDAVQVARVHSPRVSPGGDVALVASRPRLRENRDRVELAVRWSSGEWSFLEAESVSLPRWGPGGLLAVAGRMPGVERERKGSGIYIVSRGGSRLLAWLERGVSGLDWAGESMLVAFTRKGRGWFYDEDGDYAATDQLPVWRDGAGLVAGLSSVLVAVDSWSGRVEEAVDTGSESAWGPVYCGGLVYYHVPVDWRRPLERRVMAVKPGEWEPFEAARGYVGQMACVEGRLYLLAHHMEIGIASHYKLHVLEGDGRLECVSCGATDRNIWSIAGSLGGDPVVQVADSGRVGLYRLAGGRLEPVVEGDLWVHEAHADAGLVAYTASTPTRPVEAYLWRGGSPERLTRYNAWVEERLLSEPRHFRVEAAGDTVDAWILLPPSLGEGEKAPLILYVHGGPKGMHGYRFNAEYQLLAGRGYAVLLVNPRGSDGYSEEFADIRGRYGEDDYEQLMAAVDEAIRRYPVDPERLAVTGISYGGYMTYLAVTKTNRFRAAVAENGIADWIADYWASDIGYWFDPDQIGGTPFDNLQGYLEKSPAFHADRVETPVLTIHSMEDYRCFIDQALAMHTALLHHGKESVLVVFRKGSHGHSVLAEPRHRRKRLEIKLRFLDEKLRGATNNNPAR